MVLGVALSTLLAACSSTPPKKVNPITRLPPQTLPVPKASERPPFGSDEFNRIKDIGPDSPQDVSQVPDAEPADEPRSKYGNQSPYTVLGETYRLLQTSKGFTQTGNASWYGKKFHGLRTSSGELYDMYKMTAAHRNLPLPTYVRVTNLSNQKTVIVKVNDRGPFHSERVMDLSYAAASKLDIIKAGTAKVRIEAIDPAEFQRKLGSTGKPQKPASADMASDEARFYVQVGAFGALENATALQAHLLDLVYAPIVIAKADGGHAVNRVQVGPFFTREDADKVADIIRGNKLGEPIIIKR
jgi:rare lipoprotein A